MIRFPHRAVPIALAAIVVDVIGFGIVTPVLPGLITDLGDVGLPEATRIGGYMLAAFAVAQFFAGPVLGALGDRFGRRPVIIASLVAFSIDYLLMAAAPTLAWLFVGRVVAGVAGSLGGPVGSVLADVSPPEHRAEMFGLMGAAFGVGFVIGPALGGVVAELGDRAPFIVSGALAGLNAAAAYFLLPETLDPANRRPFRWRDANVVAAFRPLFLAGAGRIGAAPLLVAWFLWQVGQLVYPATWSFWATIRFGWDARSIGLSLAWVGLLSVLVQAFVTRRALARLTERQVAVIGLAASTACLIAYAFATQGWQVYAFFLVGAFGALTYPAMNGMVSRAVDATRQGAIQGGLSSLNSVAAILGPLVATQSLGYGTARGFDGAAFLVAAALLAGTALVLVLLLPPLRPADVPQGAPA